MHSFPRSLTVYATVMEPAKLASWVIICIVIRRVCAQLQLYEGDICAPNNKRCENYRTCSVVHEPGNEKRRLPICGFNGTEVYVCCTAALFDKPLEYSNFNSVSDMSPPVSVCQMYRSDICSGEKAVQSAKYQENLEDELPFLALIGYGQRNRITWNCGGALISSKYILTAAHCSKIDSLGKANWVRLKNDNQTIYTVDVQFNHPDYQPPLQYNDIALLRINKHIQFDSNIRPLCLPNPPYTDYTSFYNVMGAGWGHIGKDIIPGRGYLKVVESGRCSLAGGPHELPEGTDHESIICASTLGQGKPGCKNHFGGSVLFVSDNVGPYSSNCYLGSLVGILSIGKECGQTDFPGVYTNVSHFMPWIRAKVWPANTTHSELLWPKKLPSGLFT